MQEAISAISWRMFGESVEARRLLNSGSTSCLDSRWIFFITASLVFEFSRCHFSNKTSKNYIKNEIIYL